MTLGSSRAIEGQQRSSAKRQAPTVGDARRPALIARIEACFAASDPRDKAKVWKFDKHDPRGRQDMITVARNLHAIMAGVPRGQKTTALAAAGFNGQEQSGYLGNVCLGPDVITVTKARLRRLTPRVDRYWNVALGCGLEREDAIVRLFARTSYDEVSAGPGVNVDWADRLVDTLTRLGADVADRTDLAALFDRMSRANLCLAGETGFDPRVTDWLSETFHKFDFSASAMDKPQGFWLYDTNDEGTPRCGLPLFSPKVGIETRSFMVDSPVISVTPQSDTGEASPGAIQILLSSTLHLAIVPMALSLDETSGVAVALMERPSAAISRAGTDEPIWSVDVSDERISVRTEAATWEVALPAELSLDPDLVALVASSGCHVAESPDLMDGCWRCFPLTASHVRDRLGRPAAAILLPTVQRRGMAGRRVLEHDDIDPAAIDFHGADPSYFPPIGSIASGLAGHLGKHGAIASALEQEVRSMAAAFNELVERMREGAAADEGELA